MVICTVRHRDSLKHNKQAVEVVVLVAKVAQPQLHQMKECREYLPPYSTAHAAWPMSSGPSLGTTS